MQEKDLKLKIAKIQGQIIAYVMAVLCGLFLLIITLWLVIKGGDNVGPHLSLLSNFFPGYTVTYWGSMVGAFYGALTGGVLGWMIGFFYSLVIKIRH